MTGRTLSVQSDARYRFERGIDPTSVTWGLEVATRLIIELCGGEPSYVVVAGDPALATGHRLPAGAGADAGGRYCERLRSAPACYDGARLRRRLRRRKLGRPPPWRNDMGGEACLVEEVIRLLGYDRIPATPLPRPSSLPKPALSPMQRRRPRPRGLAARGLTEAVTYSFVIEGRRTVRWRASACDWSTDSADLDVMRPSLLPNLILAAQRNAARGQRDAALFEVGPQYAGDRPEEQAIVATAIRAGRTGPALGGTGAAGRRVRCQGGRARRAGSGGVRSEKLTVARRRPPGITRADRASLNSAEASARPSARSTRGSSSDSNAIGPVVGCEVFVDAVPVKAEAGAGRPPLALSPCSRSSGISPSSSARTFPPKQ